MQRAGTVRSGLMGWLLCALVALFAISPAQCEACDGVSLTRQVVASRHVVTTVSAASADTCDGVCSCCLLQVMPLQFANDVAEQAVPGRLVAEPVQPELIQATAFFRPPRSFSAS